MLSPLQLKKVLIQKLSIEANDKFDSNYKKDGQYSIEASMRVGEPEQESIIKVFLFIENKAKHNKKACELKKVEIALEGQFFVHPNIPRELRQKIIPYNCVAMLFSTARGIILEATGNFPGGSFVLPTLDFTQILSENKHDKNPPNCQKD
ncbi:MAG: protein-export chaperone SecB [Candidatus Eremiobacteraeota bacterium]|nr:protein-export chaperone SecB [Candidatus Eremiobacteraeota bacterium]